MRNISTEDFSFTSAGEISNMCGRWKEVNLSSTFMPRLGDVVKGDFRRQLWSDFVTLENFKMFKPTVNMRSWKVKEKKKTVHRCLLTFIRSGTPGFFLFRRSFWSRFKLTGSAYVDKTLLSYRGLHDAAFPLSFAAEWALHKARWFLKGKKNCRIIARSLHLIWRLQCSEGR